jgi:hypothetical protein
MVIYKYFSFENAAKCLLTNSILASHFDEYNDPFEASIAWAKATRSIANKSDDESDDDSEDMSFAELTEERKRKYSNARNDVRVTCFSRTNKEILLWSHYAENHKGIAICFWSTQMFESKIGKKFKSVDYNGEKIRIFKDTKNSIFDNKIQKSFTTKAKIWSYEEEVRLLIGNRSGDSYRTLPNNQNKCFVEILSSSIHSVYYGCKLSRDMMGLNERVNRELLHQYLAIRSEYEIRNGLRDIAINEYECKQSNNLYALNIFKLGPSAPLATPNEIDAILNQCESQDFQLNLNSEIIRLTDELQKYA